VYIRHCVSSFCPALHGVGHFLSDVVCAGLLILNRGGF